MTAARYTVTIAGEDYIIVPETFVEGAVRRQAEFAYLGEEDLKSRPDTREWLHNSWIGGAQWEKPLYGRNNQDTYFESGDLSFTDRAGAVQESSELVPLDGSLGTPSVKFAAWSEDGIDGIVVLYRSSGTTWQWASWLAGSNDFADIAGRTSTLGASDVCMAISAGSDGRIYALMDTGVVAWFDPTANTNGTFNNGDDVQNGAALWADRDYVWVYDADTLNRYEIAAVLTPEVQAVDTDIVSGTTTFTYDGETTSAINTPVTAGTLGTALELLPNITSVTVTGTSPNLEVQFNDGNGALSLMTVVDSQGTGFRGTIITLVTQGKVPYNLSVPAIADDDWGMDAFSRSAVFTGKPIIPEWSCTRAISTSEGVFYVKNVFEGGLPVAKVYRVDRDASGSHILTPIGTLPKGQVAINIAHHLGSILISTVPNFHKAVLNVTDQKVTIYHVTGKSIGAIGSLLGGTNVDETPVWLLGTHNEMLYIGGRKRLWQYDGRVGAFHAVHVESNTKYTDHGAGFTGMATVDSTSGAGILFMHTSQDGQAAAPYFELLIEDSLITTSDDTAFITSNWFDFDLPMEEKTIYEVFYDISNLRTDSTILIQVSADGGAFTTVATLTGGTSSNTLRQALSTPVTGYKFQYKLVWSTDTVTSSAEPSRLYSLGFGAFAGEMVDILQFTVDGNESMNIENNVQIPSDVYTALSLLRNTKEEVTVSHSYNTYDGDTLVTGQFRVSSVTGRHEDAHSGEYEIQLIEVPAP